MGVLLSFLRGAENAGGSDVPDIPVTLEAPPSPEEKEIFNYISELLGPSAGYLDSLKQYAGCGDAIRKAISSPSKETEEAAWNAVCPAVLRLKDYYEFSQRLEEAFPRVLMFLCQGDVGKNLETYQATTRRFADVLHFISLFDELKMGNPNVQNDFSYYRRTLGRIRMTNPGWQNVVVNDELANRMSLFYAHSTPMMKALTDSITVAINSQNKGLPSDNVSDCLSCVAAVCYNAVAKLRVADPAMVEYCLRVMVTTTILYDHIDPQGVFQRNSKINVRAFVKVIQSAGGVGSEGFMNSLRYNTVHLNDEGTPKATKQLFVKQ